MTRMPGERSATLDDRSQRPGTKNFIHKLIALRLEWQCLAIAAFFSVDAAAPHDGRDAGTFAVGWDRRCHCHASSCVYVSI